MSSPENATRVMLVDDNSLILDLMRKGLEPHASVVTCADSTDALLQCINRPPELVICDYRMPGLDGKHFLEKLRARPETRRVRIMLVASKADIDEHLRPVADLVEDFVVKPFFVSDLVSVTRKVLERIRSDKALGQPQQNGIIRGRLSEMNMIDLLQSLELGQKNCALTVKHGGQSGRMFFDRGQIHHAELGSLVGDEAVYGVVSWPDGFFEIDFNSHSDQQTTTRSTQALLMEALRLLDEQKRSSSD